MERDLIFCGTQTKRNFISTHTLTWSVTVTFTNLLSSIIHFNSHAHVERDWINEYNKNCIDISTHTLTWSVTTARLLNRLQNDFNSHAHVERDLLNQRRHQPKLHISTHTLTWSVTLIVRPPVMITWISTHTLTWSVTFLLLVEHIICDISTHTLTWSVTRSVFSFFLVFSFQLTRSRGA